MLAISAVIAAIGSAQLPTMTSAPKLFDLYPEDAQRREASIYQLLKLKVSPRGTVEDCKSVFVSGYPGLAIKVCEVLRATRWTPGKDGSGKPLFSVVVSPFNWTLGNGRPAPHTEELLELTVDHLPEGSLPHPISDLIIVVDETGKVESCDLKASAGNAALDKAASASGPAAADLQPVKDREGRPVRYVQELKVGFAVVGAGGR